MPPKLQITDSHVVGTGGFVADEAAWQHVQLHP